MKYIIRFIACLPMMSVCMALVAAFALMFSYPLVVIPFIGLFFAMQIVCRYYEETVQAITEWLRTACNRTDEVA